MKYLTTIIIAAIIFLVAWVWIVIPTTEGVTNAIQNRVNQINIINDKLN